NAIRWGWATSHANNVARPAARVEGNRNSRAAGVAILTGRSRISLTINPGYALWRHSREQSAGPYIPAAILSPCWGGANSPIRARLITAMRIGEEIFAPIASVT